MADDSFHIVQDDSAFSVGTDDVGVVGMLVDETTPDSADEGDIAAPRITADRKQLIVVVDSTTDSQRLGIDASGNAQAILAANSGVDIGDVDVTSVIPGTGATNLGKAVDDAAGGTDTGVALLAVRDDTLTTLTPVDGDYTHLRVDSTGALHVTGSLGGNASVIVDDAAFTVGTSSVTAVGFLADETTPDSVDEGDIGAPRMTLDRKVLTRVVGATDANRLDVDSSGHAQIDIAASSAVVSVDDNAGSLTIDNATLSVTGGGVEASALRVTIANDSTGLLSVDDNGGSLTIDQATHDSLNANANLQVADTDVSATNPVPVTIVDPGTSSTEIHDYDTAAAVAGGATDNHDYTVANTTFLLRSVIFGASGGIKAEIQTGPVASLATRAVGFIPRGEGGVQQLNFNPPIEVPSTSTGTVRVIRTNRQGGAQDLYSTIIGNDIT